MSKVSIIGGGYTALSCAKKLLDNNNEVTIFEKDANLGGLAQGIKFEDTYIEKHYRHIFKSDKYVLKLIDELGLENALNWNATKMGYYSKQGLYEFGTLISLLKYKPLTFMEKILFGLSILKIKSIKKYDNIENYTAEEWIIKHVGKSVYKKIWEPLLIGKFGDRKSEISMAWLWGKIKLRSSSGTKDGEKLGYLDGSFCVLTQKLKEYLENNGCSIMLQESVKQVQKKMNKWSIVTEKNVYEDFDYVVNTVVYPIFDKIFNQLQNEEKEKMLKLNFTSAKTLMIYSRKKLTDFYWINIGDDQIPFGGIIEHTNMIDSGKYNNCNIIYISNYLYQDDPIFSMNKNQLFDFYYPYLQKINPDFKKDDILKLECFDELYAQPIITTQYSKNKLEYKMKTNGVFLGTMAQIYPEDRGMNYAIKVGWDIANLINEDS